jgi:tetratricopeptide (TPR) repeat protein
VREGDKIVVMETGTSGYGRLTSGRRTYILAAVIVLAVIATYSNHFLNAFHFDDAHAVVNNIYIRSLKNIPLFFKDATTFSSLPSNQTYRPVVVTSLALDYYMGKRLNSFYFHLSMFVLFIVQGFFMYLLYLRVFNSYGKYRWIDIAALLTVAWYLLHPANAETINYISARSDTLSTLFGLIFIVLFAYSPFCRKWGLYLIPFAAAVLAKPIAAAFVPLLMLYVYLFEEVTIGSGRRKKEVRPGIMQVLRKTWPSLAFCVVLMVFTKMMTPATFTPGTTPAFNYVITQPYVILHYFKTFFLPLGLSADTDLAPFETMADIRFIAGLVFIAALLCAATAACRNKKTRPIAFGLFWFFITLLPTSLFPLAEVMNDHRIFLPYVGLTMSVCWSIALMLDKAAQKFSSEKKVFFTAALIIALALTAYAYGTHERNKVWRTGETLWRDVAEKSPRNGRGLMNYGLALMARADYAGAEEYFARALEFTPNYAYLHINLGVLNAATDRPENAEWYFKRAISLGSGYPECYFYYARFLKDQKRYDEAILNLTKTLELASAHMDARHLLMSIYLDLEDFAKLKELASQTLRIYPGDRLSADYLDSASMRK